VNLLKGRKMNGAIHKLAADVVRIPCSKVLLSPDLHDACIEELQWRWMQISTGADLMPVLSGGVYIRGVPCVSCGQLEGMEYALVPKGRG
jgi:hypothetical protein